MKNIISHFKNIEQKQFKIYAIILLLANDLYNWSQIFSKYNDKESITKLINNSLKLSGNKNMLSNMNHQFYDQLFVLFSNWLLICFVILFSFHLVMYYLFHKNKRSAYLYLLSVTIIASLFFLISPLNNLSHFNLSILTDLFQGLVYLYLTIGLLKFLPSNKKIKK